MSIGNKLLIGFFIVLLLIILGEVGYFYIFSQKENSVKTVTQTDKFSPSQKLPVTTTSTPTKIDAIFDDTKAYVEFLGPSIKNKVLKSLLITTSFETTIIKAEKINTTVDLPASNIPQQISAVLVIDDNNQGQLEYPFSEAELMKLDIVSVDKDLVETPIELEDLKPGDKIFLKLSLDLLKHPNDNLVSGEIKKYPFLSPTASQ